MRIRRIEDRGKPVPLQRAILVRISAARDMSLPDGLMQLVRWLHDGNNPRFSNDLAKALAATSAAELDRRLSCALITGIWACALWIADRERLSIYKANDENVRAGFLSFKAWREVSSEPYALEIRNYLILGYMLALGADRIRVKHWRSLIPALAPALLSSPKIDSEARMFALLRAQYRRMKPISTAKRDRALGYIKQVYGVV